MQVIQIIMDFLQHFVQAVRGIYKRLETVVITLGMWVFKLRKLFMGLPVLLAALQLAIYSRDNLPETVGFNIQANGEFAQVISRDTAIYGPLALTCACLVLMLLSRRTVYPWIISIFTLTLPVLILALNMFVAQ